MAKPENELEDHEIDAIHEEASEAALNAWGPGGCSAVNPYPKGSNKADIWAFAFRSAYASENGR